MYSIDHQAIEGLDLTDTTVGGKIRFAAEVIAATAPGAPKPRATQRSAHMLDFYAEIADANADRIAASDQLAGVLDLAGETISSKAFDLAVDVIVGAMRGREDAA